MTYTINMDLVVVIFLAIYIVLTILQLKHLKSIKEKEQKIIELENKMLKAVEDLEG